MNYTLKSTSRFEKDLRNLNLQMRRRIDKAILELAKTPRLGKPLHGMLAGKWSLRIEDYRIIYTVEESEKTVLLYTVQHRRTVYR
ncbi:MAG: type II toxin-antitoxin system RelE family toxin [Candidatus Ranarchaeia archaeon]